MISSELRSQIAAILEALEIGDELYWQPSRQAIPGAWTGHLAIAFWLIKAVRPAMFVELGTHSGNSYSAFCQAIAQFGLSSRAFAVDTWRGDEHSGLYGEEVFQELHAFNETHFAGFSKLLRSSFDEARSYFPDTSIDLLHIDGLHTYEAVKHDFDTWKSALSASAVVVFHDTNVRERDFGVWKLWQELAEIYPSFEFHHSEGLGVLGVGETQPRLLRRLFEIGSDPQSTAIVRLIFASRGETFRNRSQLLHLNDRLAVVSSELQTRSHRVFVLEQDVSNREQEIGDLRQELVSRDASLARHEQLVSNLQQEIAGRDATLRDRDEAIHQRDSTIVSKDQIISAKQRKIAELDDSAAKLRKQLTEAANRHDEERSAA